MKNRWKCVKGIDCPMKNRGNIAEGVDCPVRKEGLIYTLKYRSTPPNFHWAQAACAHQI